MKKTICSNCKAEFDYANTPETSAGTCECPNCKCRVNQEGQAVNCGEAANEFQEAKHPRGDHGKFADSQSKSAWEATDKASDKDTHEAARATHKLARRANREAADYFQQGGNQTLASHYLDKTREHHAQMHRHVSAMGTFQNEPDQGTPLRILAIRLRAAQLIAHNGHHLTSGETFQQDHEFFDKLHEAYEEAYDSVLERMVGNGEPVNAGLMQKDAASLVGDFGSSPTGYFSALLLTEQVIQGIVNAVATNLDEADKQLTGDIADKGKERIYQLRQRVAGAEAEVANAGTSEGVKKSWEKRRQGIANRMQAAKRNYEEALHHSAQGNSEKAKQESELASMHASVADKMARELDSGYGDAIAAHEHAGKAHRDASGHGNPHTKFHLGEAEKHKNAIEQLRQLMQSKPSVANAEASNAFPPKAKDDSAPNDQEQAPQPPSAPEPTKPDESGGPTPGICPGCKAECEDCQPGEDGNVTCAKCNQAAPMEQWAPASEGSPDESQPAQPEGDLSQAGQVAMELSAAAVAGKDASLHRQAQAAHTEAAQAQKSAGNDAHAKWHELQAAWHGNYADAKEAAASSPMNAEEGLAKPGENEASPGDDQEVPPAEKGEGEEASPNKSGEENEPGDDDQQKKPKAESANQKDCGECGSVASVIASADGPVTPNSEPPQVTKSAEKKASIPVAGKVAASDDAEMGTPAGTVVTRQDVDKPGKATEHAWHMSREAKAANTSEAHQKAVDAHAEAAEAHESAAAQDAEGDLGIHTMAAELHDRVALKHLHMIDRLGNPDILKPEVANTKPAEESDEDMKTRALLISTLAAAGVTLANDATDEAIAAEVAKLGEAAKLKVTMANDLDSARASAAELQKKLEAQFANERTQRIAENLDRGIRDGRITAAERKVWLDRLNNPATFSNELVALNSLQPKFKTSSVVMDRGERKVELTDPKARAEMFNELVDEVCKEKGLNRKKDYDKAVQEVYRRHPAFASAMEHPQLTRSGVKMRATDR